MKTTEARGTWRCDSREPTGLRDSCTQPLPFWVTGQRRKGVTELRSGSMRRDSGQNQGLQIERGGSRGRAHFPGALPREKPHVDE